LLDHGHHVAPARWDIVMIDEGEAAPVELRVALDGDDLSPRHRRADGRAVEHAGEAQIVDVARRAGHFFDAFGACHVPSDGGEAWPLGALGHEATLNRSRAVARKSLDEDRQRANEATKR